MHEYYSCVAWLAKLKIDTLSDTMYAVIMVEFTEQGSTLQNPQEKNIAISSPSPHSHETEARNTQRYDNYVYYKRKIIHICLL